jgi:hypothetical protein
MDIYIMKMLGFAFLALLVVGYACHRISTGRIMRLMKHYGLSQRYQLYNAIEYDGNLTYEQRTMLIRTLSLMNNPPWYFPIIDKLLFRMTII